MYFSEYTSGSFRPAALHLAQLRRLVTNGKVEQAPAVTPAACSSPAPVAASRVDVQQPSGHCPSAA